MFICAKYNDIKDDLENTKFIKPSRSKLTMRDKNDLVAYRISEYIADENARGNIDFTDDNNINMYLETFKELTKKNLDNDLYNDVKPERAFLFINYKILNLFNNFDECYNIIDKIFLIINEYIDFDKLHNILIDYRIKKNYKFSIYRLIDINNNMLLLFTEHLDQTFLIKNIKMMCEYCINKNRRNKKIDDNILKHIFNNLEPLLSDVDYSIYDNIVRSF